MSSGARRRQTKSRTTEEDDHLCLRGGWEVIGRTTQETTALFWLEEESAKKKKCNDHDILPQPNITPPVIARSFEPVVIRWWTHPTFRALVALVVLVLSLCVFLSHYNTATMLSSTAIGDGERSFAMTVSEEQILVNAYLGSSDDMGMFANVKLPAGGNPIDLIRLLKSHVIAVEEGEQEDG